MNRVVRRGALPVLIALVAGTVAALPSSAAPTWLSPPATALSEFSSRGQQPQVGIDAAGNTTVIWRAARDFGTDFVVEVAYRPAGGPWAATSTVTELARKIIDPDLAVAANGTAVAVWRSYTTGLVSASYRPAGGTWSDPVDLSTAGAAAFQPRVGIDAVGNAVATWVKGQKVQTSSRPAGGSWSAPVDISGTLASNDESTALAVSPTGYATAAWTFHTPDPDGRDVVQTRSLPLGGVWDAEFDLSDTTRDSDQVHVTSSASGATVAVWRQSTDSDTTVYARARNAAGGGWGSADQLSLSRGASAPQVAMDPGGNATAVWQQPDLANDVIIQTAYHSVAGQWTDADDITPAETNGFNPDVAVDAGGNAVAVWNLAEPGSVQAARRLPGGDASVLVDWSTPADLSDPGEWGAATQVAVDPAGNATAVWMHVFAGGPDDIQAAGLDAAPPVLTGLSVPASAAAGQSAAYSVAAKDVWSPFGTSWSFGDGGTATGTSTNHTYAAPGTYLVTVTATDAVGNTSTLSGNAVVVAAPVVTPTPATPTATTPKPILSGVKLTKKTIHVLKSDDSPRATKLKLTLNTDAAVKVKLKRTVKVDGQVVKAKVVRALTQGASGIKLTSKVGAKKLPPGTYKVIVTARNIVGTSAAVVLKLRILA